MPTTDLTKADTLATPRPTTGIQLTDAEWAAIDELLRGMMATESVADITRQVEVMQAFLSTLARRPAVS